MYQVILLIHVFIAVFIIALVLVQQGKGATMGAAFGSGASSTVFGSRESGSFLFRLTIGFVMLFFITSISLNYIAMRAYKQEKVISLPELAQPAAKPATTGDKPATTSSPVNTSPAALPADIPTNKK